MLKQIKIHLIFFLYLISFYLCIFQINPAFSRKYIQYNLYNFMFDNENYISYLESGSLTIGGSERILKRSFFELGFFMDISFFQFQEIKSLNAIQKEIKDLAKKLKPKITGEKNSIIQQINQLQNTYDASIINLSKIPGDSEAQMHNQINELYKKLIHYDNYERELDQKILDSTTNYQNLITKNEGKRSAIKGFVSDTTDLIGSFATQTLAASSSQSAKKASTLMQGNKAQAAKEIAKLAGNTITDIVFDIKNIEARSSFLEEQSKISLERTAVEFQEAALLAEITSIENLKKSDVDSAGYLEETQKLYTQLDAVKKAKDVLNKKKEITDTLFRIPIVMGPVFHLHILSFIVAYVELGFIVSINNSVVNAYDNISFGCRLGTGINFELFDRRFIVGVHFRYWGMENHFMSLGPTIGIRV